MLLKSEPTIKFFMQSTHMPKWTVVKEKIKIYALFVFELDEKCKFIFLKHQ